MLNKHVYVATNFDRNLNLIEMSINLEMQKIIAVDY
jgi:hypothetical protein